MNAALPAKPPAKAAPRPIATRTLQSLANVDAVALEGTFFVQAGHFPIACRLKAEPGADRLFVMFNGAVGDRSKVQLPVFARWNWGKILGGHVLSVCDPTLFLGERLRLGWFLGTRAHDPMPEMQAIVDVVQRRLGIEDGNVVFYGSSGGGFAAMRAASMRPAGRAIAVNAQTAVTGYHAASVSLAAEVFDPDSTPTSSAIRFPLRWDAVAALEDGRRLGREPRVLYVQNVDDVVHYTRHYKPFCAHFGLPHEGGTDPSGSFLAYPYHFPDGHGAEPPDVLRFIASEGLQHLR